MSFAGRSDLAGLGLGMRIYICNNYPGSAFGLVGLGKGTGQSAIPALLPTHPSSRQASAAAFPTRELKSIGRISASSLGLFIRRVVLQAVHSGEISVDTPQC